MNRLNGANCLVYSKNGKYRGRHICVISSEENQNMGNLADLPIENSKKIKIIVRDVRESLKDCKLTMLSHIKDNYYVLKDYQVKTEEYNGEDAWFIDDEKTFTSKIEEISSEEYEKIKTTAISNIDWKNIKTTISNRKLTKDKAFECLCVELINKIKEAKGDFHPRGGADGGRDYVWEWPVIDNSEIDFLNLSNDKWIMQCKYSEDPNQQLKQSEVWDEIIKVIQYNPDRYIFFTNRDITVPFYDWWKNVSSLDGRKTKFIPFSLYMVGRDNIERLLNYWTDIKEKYFE
ncbi:MAG: hypothetical protein IJ867_04680 [Clostridia bacterium]|nr:hypothetical protein [Clostridia bacterium]